LGLLLLQVVAAVVAITILVAQVVLAVLAAAVEVTERLELEYLGKVSTEALRQAAQMVAVAAVVLEA
jgi:hypothetical protein